MAGRSCFVTVGSTSFSELTTAVVTDADVLLALRLLKFAELRVQCGAGSIPHGFNHVVDGNEESWVGSRCGIKVR